MAYLFIFEVAGCTMKLTESMNTCCTSDRVACTIKVNIKETFMGNEDADVYVVNGLESENKIPIAWQI